MEKLIHLLWVIELVSGRWGLESMLALCGTCFFALRKDRRKERRAGDGV
jgi:hypothetical protein